MPSFKIAFDYFNEQVKQKQKGADRLLLPSVEGQEGGNWIVIDSGEYSIGMTYREVTFIFEEQCHQYLRSTVSLVYY